MAFGCRGLDGRRLVLLSGPWRGHGRCDESALGVPFALRSAYKVRVKAPQSRSVLGLVFLTVFLDIVGFSIVFPLFPAMLEHYLVLEGPTSTFGKLVAELREIAGADEYAVVTLFGGLLGSLYAILQFLFAPVWGGLSDRIGRRPTLLVTLFGTLASYVLWIFSGSFLLLIASRLVGGCMAGNISTATAVIADSTDDSKRAGGMGMVGMAIGLGFVLGPALGGIFWNLDLGAGTEGSWELGFALNPFSGAALIAAVLALVNLALVAMRLPETNPAEKRGSRRSHGLFPLAGIARLSGPGLLRTNLVYLFYLTAFSAMEFTLTFLAVDRFAFEPRDNMWMFVFVGLVIAFVQGGLVRRLAPRLGEKKLTLAGFGLLFPGFLLVGLSPSVVVLYLGLFCLAVGSALLMPCLSSLASRYAPNDIQGLALGTFRSMGSLARALGPLLGGVLYWQGGGRWPYLAGAVFLLLPLALAWGLPPVSPGPPGPAGPKPTAPPKTA